MFLIMNIKLFVSLYLLLSHSICLRACKICVVFVETKPESNSCRVRRVFRNLLELLSGLVSTNTTEILQARKQMEYDNNEH